MMVGSWRHSAAVGLFIHRSYGLELLEKLGENYLDARALLLGGCLDRLIPAGLRRHTR